VAAQFCTSAMESIEKAALAACRFLPRFVFLLPFLSYENHPNKSCPQRGMNGKTMINKP